MNLIEKLKAAHKEEKTAGKALMLVVVGRQGSGKSSLCGTSGLTTLYIRTPKESHGYEAACALAKRSGGTIIDANLGNAPTSNKDGQPSNDDMMKYLGELLGSASSLKSAGIQQVVVDSTSDLDIIIRNSKFMDDYCMTSKGTKNDFKTGEGFIVKYQELIINPFIKLQEAGIHCITLMAATSKDHDEFGTLTSIAPILTGFNSAYEVIRAFPDVACISRMQIENDDGKMQTHHVLVFNATIVKTSKDMKGQILKMESFTPRITGYIDPPDMIKADLKQLIKMKAEGHK